MATLSNAEIFRAAARQIREDGWYGGPTKPETDVYPRVCALSAISATGARQWVDCAALAAQRVGKLHASELPAWNNAPERTAEQVLSLFEDLAADEELKEQITAFDEDLKAAATADTLDASTPETGGLVSQPQLVEV